MRVEYEILDCDDQTGLSVGGSIWMKECRCENKEVLVDWKCAGSML